MTHPALTQALKGTPTTLIFHNATFKEPEA